MHSENIWFSWSKTSNYCENLRCHARDIHTDGRTDGWKVENRAVFFQTRNRNSLRRILFSNRNCGLEAFSNTTLILLAPCILPASPNFGQVKHGQNGPAATFCQQGICCPIRNNHFTRWTHPDISLCFRAGGRRVKYFRFSRICVAALDFFLPACCGLNFDPTNPPNIQFEPSYPKLFRGTPEVDLVSTVWPPDLSKVR